MCVGGGGLGDQAFLSASNDCGFVRRKVCSSKNHRAKTKKTSTKGFSLSRVAKPVTCQSNPRSIVGTVTRGSVFDWLASAVELGIRRSCSFYLCVHTSQGCVLSSRAGFVWS